MAFQPFTVHALCCILLLLPTIVGALDRVDTLIGYSETTNTGSRKEQLTLTTPYGVIHVNLRPDVAPHTVEYIKGLVTSGIYDDCFLYRAEPAGPTKDAGKEVEREGYALIQGGAYTCGKQQSHGLALEIGLAVRAWTASLIAGTSEFFISLGDHRDWDNAFSVFGEVEDKGSREVLLAVAALPTKQESHPSGTVLRILTAPLPFKATIEIVAEQSHSFFPNVVAR